MIGFNKPYISGKEFEYIQEAIKIEKLSGNGIFTSKCHEFFEGRYGFKKTLLTHSCTAALEMAALLLDIKAGDEVVMPSYTFVSTANAFLLRGARIIFADSNEKNPNVDPAHVRSLITKKTKAIVVVHYGGVACDMDALMQIAEEHNIYVVEDCCGATSPAAQEAALSRMVQAGAVRVTTIAALLEWQRDWKNKEHYNALMGILKGQAGAYGVGVEYAYTMVHHAPQSAQNPQVVPKSGAH